IVMNPPGFDYGTNTLWEYTVSSINQIHNYLVFTDNTNFTTTPIKFAVPPFVGSSSNPPPILFTSFELGPIRTYAAGEILPGGWRVDAESVDLIGPPLYGPAADGVWAIDINGSGAQTR